MNFGKYAVTKKLSSSEGKPARQSNYDFHTSIPRHISIRQVKRPWEKCQVDNYLGYFSCPNK
jgi:hypothetical protein